VISPWLKHRGSQLLFAAVPFVLVIVAWVLLSGSGLVNETFLPSVVQVGRSLWEVFTQDDYLKDVWVSSYRVSGAFVLSVLLAVPLGLLAGFAKPAKEAIEPFVGFVRYLPVPAFVPLCILWFGLGDLAKIAVIFLGTFFQLILLVADAAREVPKEYFEAALALGAKQGQLFSRVLWPASLPGVVNSCRTAVGWAWTYLVVAEIAGATSGVGFRIMEAQRFIATPKIFAGIVVIGVLGLATDMGFSALYRWKFSWRQ
jgi:NitT/TauT family transport system permease protein